MRPAAQPQGLNCRVCPCVEECLCCKQWKCLFNLCSLQGIPGLNVNKNGNTGKHTKPSDTQTNVAGRHCSCFRASPYIDLSCYTCGFGFADRLLAVGEPQKTSIFAGTTTRKYCCGVAEARWRRTCKAEASEKSSLVYKRVSRSHLIGSIWPRGAGSGIGQQRPRGPHLDLDP